MQSHIGKVNVLQQRFEQETMLLLIVWHSRWRKHCGTGQEVTRLRDRTANDYVMTCHNVTASSVPYNYPSWCLAKLFRLDLQNLQAATTPLESQPQ